MITKSDITKAFNTLRKWKNIRGYKGHYMISNHGEVWSLQRTAKTIYGKRQVPGKILKLRISNQGYLRAHLCKNNIRKMFSVHRLVALAFIPNPTRRTTVNHRDSNKLNNHVANLEWLTIGENHKHSFDNGRYKMLGKNHPQSKLGNQKVKQIRKSYGKIPSRVLAKKFNISPSTICDIVKRRTWSWLP